MRERIATGQWPVGQRIPTLGQLSELYDANVNTVRQGQQLLVVEGLLRSDRQAGGMVVVATPPPTPGEPGTPPLRDELVGVQQAVARMLVQLPEQMPTLPYVVDEKRQPRGLLQYLEEQTAAYPGRAWAPMTGWRCDTCGTEGNQERGWIEPAVDARRSPTRSSTRRRRPRRKDREPGEGAPPESCVTDKHKLTRWYGPEPGEGQRITKLDELHIERTAHMHEALRLLELVSPDPVAFTAYLAAARWHARQATKLTRKLAGL